MTLAAAAAVTKKIKVGAGICLIVERDPITTAKEVASLDVLSNGRLLFGIGGGWNAEEMENHGTVFKTRWKLLRERVLAMKEIWTKDEAEFHGEFVNFDPDLVVAEAGPEAAPADPHGRRHAERAPARRRLLRRLDADRLQSRRRSSPA